MGVEFLTRTRRSIVKHIDTKRAALATPDLFTRQPSDQPRCAIFSLATGATVQEGEVVIVELQDKSLRARRENTIIGTFDSPAADVVAGIDRTGGVAGGIVKRVHMLANKAEVAFC
jgi:hypothetical protein